MAVKRNRRKNVRNSNKQERKDVEISQYQSDEIQDTQKRKRKRLILLFIIIVALAAILYYYKGLLIAAIVNGQPIPRFTIVSELEKQSGKQTLESYITKTLILQESVKQKITVSKSEIESELKKIEENFTKQGQKLDDLLKTRGMTRKNLEDDIEIQKKIQKLLSKDIKITDKEVSDYVDKNKDLLGQQASSKDLEKTAREQLEQQKLAEKFQTWIENLKKKAKIYYFVSY